MSDVPLGAFLSGGVDSTIVVGLMSRLMAEPVKTFSIGFEGDPAYDETAYARMAADALQDRSHRVPRRRRRRIDLIDTLIWHHDGPFGDSSAVPTYIVSQLTREQVTVVLTGDGGDELFAGYLRFYAALMSERIPRRVRRGGAGGAVARCRRRRAIGTGSRARSGSRAAMGPAAGRADDAVERALLRRSRADCCGRTSSRRSRRSTAAIPAARACR